MSCAEIKEKLIVLCAEIFQKTGVDTDLLEYVDFEDDLGMDSLTFITLIVEIESHFEIIIPDELLLMENFRTINAIGQIVENQLILLSEDIKEESYGNET
jgi:acyl carrier protein